MASLQMSSEYYDDEAPPSPIEMGTLSFATAHYDLFTQYVELRVHGVHSHEAFRRVFPFAWFEGSNGFARANAVEFNPQTISRLRDAIANVKPSTLWNPNLAIHAMLSLAQDPFAKDNTRLGALKELNVLCNIIIVDENGKSRAGRSLDDFYRDLDAKASRSEAAKKDPADAQTPTEANGESK